jgi:hypothetical protein
MEIPNRVSTATSGKDVSSTRYDGPFYFGESSNDLIDGISNKSSTETFPLSYGFKNPSGAQTWEALTDLSLTPYFVVDQSGNPGYVMSTVNNTWFIPLVDLEAGGITFNPVEDIYNPDDRNQDRLLRWKEVTEQSNAIESEELPEFGGLIVARHENPSDSAIGKFVTEIGYFGPLNQLGKYLSMTENLRQSWNNYLESSEGKALASEKSVDGSDVQYLGVSPGEGIVYGLNGDSDNGIVLLKGTRTYDILSSLADRFDVSIDDMVNRGLGEEAMHIHRGIGPLGKNQLIKEERATKQELLEFYQDLADGAGSSTRLRQKYLNIVKELTEDISQVEENYKNFGKQTSDSDVGMLETILKAEAHAKGLRTTEEVRAYVASKLEDALSEDPYSEARAYEKSDYDTDETEEMGVEESEDAAYNVEDADYDSESEDSVDSKGPAE